MSPKKPRAGQVHGDVPERAFANVEHVGGQGEGLARGDALGQGYGVVCHFRRLGDVHEELPRGGVYPAVKIDVIQSYEKRPAPRYYVLCGPHFERGLGAFAGGYVIEQYGVVGVVGQYALGFAAVCKPDASCAYAAYVVYFDIHGKLPIPADGIGRYLAGGYEKLRLFGCLFGVGVLGLFAVCNRHEHGEALLLLLPQHVEVVRLQRDGI